MGLFNYVTCEIELPDGYSGDLQSKDLDPALSHLKITAAGRLMILIQRFEAVPLDERPYPDDPVRQIIGSRRVVAQVWRDLDFHGDFRFYGAGEATGPFHDYCARFTHGQVEWVKLVEHGLPRSNGVGEGMPSEDDFGSKLIKLRGSLDPDADLGLGS